MSYENAPATKMVATHCCCCGKPLVDAKSVEIGIGPVCRKQHGYLYIDDLSDEARKQANTLVYQIAADQKNAMLVVKNCEQLFELGFAQLVAVVMKRTATVKIANLDNGRIGVSSPYDPVVVDEMRKVKGRKWDKEHKINTFPGDDATKKAIHAILQKHYQGHAAFGPKGPFVITAPKPKQTPVAPVFNAQLEGSL